MSVKAGNMNLSIALAVAAVAFATINVVGGYVVTDRMLGMFKKKDAASNPVLSRYLSRECNG